MGHLISRAIGSGDVKFIDEQELSFSAGTFDNKKNYVFLCLKNTRLCHYYPVCRHLWSVIFKSLINQLCQSYLFLKQIYFQLPKKKEFNEMKPCIGLKSRIGTGKWLGQRYWLVLNSESSLMQCCCHTTHRKCKGLATKLKLISKSN